MNGVQLPYGYSLQNHFEEAVYFLPPSSQKVLVFIWSTSEEWKDESTLETPSVFEHRTPGLEIPSSHNMLNVGTPLYIQIFLPTLLSLLNIFSQTRSFAILFIFSICLSYALVRAEPWDKHKYKAHPEQLLEKGTQYQNFINVGSSK